jgi:hypothetical protein
MKSRLLLIFTVVLLFCSCDSHRDERDTVQRRLMIATTSMGYAKELLDASVKALSDTEPRYQKVRATLQENEPAYEKTVLELSQYSMDHVIAAKAVISSNPDTGAMYKDAREEVKYALTSTDTAESGYCLRNKTECTEVSAQLNKYSVQISFIEQLIATAKKDEGPLLDLIIQHKEIKEIQEGHFEKYSAEVISLSKKLETLQCKLPFCLQQKSQLSN